MNLIKCADKGPRYLLVSVMTATLVLFYLSYHEFCLTGIQSRHFEIISQQDSSYPISDNLEQTITITTNDSDDLSQRIENDLEAQNTTSTSTTTPTMTSTTTTSTTTSTVRSFIFVRVWWLIKFTRYHLFDQIAAHCVP